MHYSRFLAKYRYNCETSKIIMVHKPGKDWTLPSPYRSVRHFLFYKENDIISTHRPRITYFGIYLDRRLTCAVIKPIWMYGILLWGTDWATNLDVVQSFQSKTLRTVEILAKLHKDNPGLCHNTDVYEDKGILLIELLMWGFWYRSRFRE